MHRTRHATRVHAPRTPRSTPTQNPRILDTAVALQSSRVHRIAAAMAVGKHQLLPPGTIVATSDGPKTVTAADMALLLEASVAGPSSEASSAPASVPAESSALVPASKLEALIPTHATVETMLLRRPAPTNVIAWPARPSEGSPYDQLVLRPAECVREVARSRCPSRPGRNLA